MAVIVAERAPSATLLEMTAGQVGSVTFQQWAQLVGEVDSETDFRQWSVWIRCGPDRWQALLTVVFCLAVVWVDDFERKACHGAAHEICYEVNPDV